MSILIVILAVTTTAATEGFWQTVPAGAWTLAGAVVGTIGLKLTEKWLSKNKDRRDDRTEFRDQIIKLQDRLDAVENEVTFWRNRFYEEQEENATLRIMMIEGGLTPPAKKVIPPSEQ